MTHPDIINAEIFGGRRESPPNKIGECLYCENDVFDDSGEVTVSTDGLFCDMDCCCEYYEIRKL